jgi:multimeric flavodoxin WrbA
MKPAENMTEFLSSVAEADLIILAFPLYIDCLPYTVINALEHIADDRRTRNITKKQSLTCVVNSGFVECYQNNTAVAICEQFAHEAGFNWVGGLALGGGGAISGRDLSKVGKPARFAVKSLDLAANALVNDKPVPREAIELMAKPPMPRWLYLFIANRIWKNMAKKYGTRKKLDAKPYLR